MQAPCEPHGSPTYPHLPILEVSHVRHPALQAVEDVGGVHDGGAPLLTLGPAKGKRRAGVAVG
jgi:hypothetical protein